MQEYQTKSSSFRRGRYSALAVTLAVLAIGSAGFAAAGGVEMVKTWFVTVTVEVDGQVIDDVDITDAHLSIETEGEMATVTIDGLELDGDALGGEDGEPQEVTIHLFGAAAAVDGDTMVFESEGAFVPVTEDGSIGAAAPAGQGCCGGTLVPAAEDGEEADSAEDDPAETDAHVITVTVNGEFPDADAHVEDWEEVPVAEDDDTPPEEDE